nr:acyl-CoA dehydrogenase family protein [Kibdelosporangium sp. MJ126-NF4]CEL13025.1 FIG00817795: hypothetical protein [Kibdelosporangium sp. MJ126-NF4]CTQ98711.1 FIG00817795: hypothetical protein [Kibdelosporangium sp. MJ126-NF4]
MPDFRELIAVAATAADRRSLWRGLGESGALGQLHESSEMDDDKLGVLLAELDACAPMGDVLAVCVQVATVIPVLRGMADGGLARDVLEEMLHGKTTVALAATDASLSGSALMDIRTTVTPTEHKAVLNGGKEWITNALDADYALVLARHRAARHVTSFRWALVPTDRPGVAREPSGDTFPTVGHLRFTDVELDREHLVGRQGRALAEFAGHLGSERLAGVLWARALTRRVLLDTRTFLGTRSTGDGVLWDNAVVRHRFAQCVLEWHRLAALCRRPVSIADGMLLKAACGQSVDHILGECVHLRGAEAFRDGGVASVRERAAMFGIAGGATGTMLAGVADYAEQLLDSVQLLDRAP